MAEKGYSGSGVDINSAAGDMAFAGTYMGTHNVCWEEHRKAFLYRQAIQRIIVIRDPDAISELQNAEIDTTTSRGAALYF